MSAIIETPRAEIGSAPVGAVPAYTVTARVLHWITAAAILLMLPLGWASANSGAGRGRIGCTTCIVRSERRLFPSCSYG